MNWWPGIDTIQLLIKDLAPFRYARSYGSVLSEGADRKKRGESKLAKKRTVAKGIGKAVTQTAAYTDRSEPSPVELILELQHVFPDFSVAMEEHDEVYNPISLHTVIRDFAYWIGISLPTATQKQVEDLGRWLDSAVESGGNLENAVSTCLLEHAFQLDIEKLLRPHINAATKRAMHP